MRARHGNWVVVDRSEFYRLCLGGVHGFADCLLTEPAELSGGWEIREDC